MWGCEFTQYLAAVTGCAQRSPWEASNYLAANDFPVVRGTRRFITILTTARRFWSSPESDESSSHLPSFLKARFNIIASSAPRSSKLSLSFKFPNQNSVCICLFRHTYYMTHPSRPLSCGHPSNIRWTVQLINLLIMHGYGTYSAYLCVLCGSETNTAVISLCSIDWFV
jgi:hypothetical protein